MKQENHTYDIYYDKEADFLEIFFGKPSKSHAEEIEEGVFVRRDENTNETVILLENLATGQREDVMRVEESDLALIGGTPDGENILVTPYNWDAPTNLFVYHIPTKEFRQVTDTEKRCWYDFVKSSGDDDVHIIRQYNNNGTNAYLKLDEDKPLAELVGFGK